jgi:hypothetical protein
MDFLDWINRNRPGKTQYLPDRIEIAHESGEHSTLWKRSDNSDFARLRKLGTVYMQFLTDSIYSRVLSSLHPF